jgi:RNA polymerase sigma-70 factor (ECF subfamily)
VISAQEHDAQLMLRVREGDVTSFTVLVVRHRVPILNFMFRMVQNRAIAEELAQERYRKRQAYKPTAKFTTWLFRIATNLALNWIRDHKKERASESLQDEVVEGLEHQVADFQTSIEQKLVCKVKLIVRQAIRVASRAAARRRLAAVVPGLEYTEIARGLGCSESALKAILFRAYQTLRVRLAHLA